MYKPSENIQIGIFDSGVGGLSVWKEIIKILPTQNFIYFADSAFAPYGPRPATQIIERAQLISEFLINKGASIIVVACNTATSAAITHLREQFRIPFIGMEPAVKPASALTRSGVIGVLATRGTLGGSLYNSTLEKFASGVKVIEMVGDGLVPLIEAGNLSGNETMDLLRRYILPMVEGGADCIVLGCTHYPFIRESIKKIAGESVTIIDPAPAVARHLYKVSVEKGLSDMFFYDNIIAADLYKSCYSNTLFYSTGDISTLVKMAKSIVPGIPDNCFIETELKRP